MIAFLMPTHFPNQGNPEAHVSLRAKFSRTSLARLDVLGAALLLAATVLIVFGFEEAGSRYPWASAPILSTLVIGALLLVAFIFWERIVGRPRRVQEPIFPLRLMKRRVFAGLMLYVPAPCASVWCDEEHEIAVANTFSCYPELAF